MAAAPVKLTGGMVPKLYLNCCSQTFGDSAEPLIIGTLYFSTTGPTAMASRKRRART